MTEEGFTLVEILAAVTITGIILLSLFALLQQSFQLWNAVGDYNYWEQNFRVLEAELNRDLHNMFFSPLTTRNLFKGSERQMIFYQLSKTGKLKKITYSFDSYQKELIKHVIDVESNQEEKKIEFFSNAEIKDFQIKFYDAEAEYFKSYWSQEERMKELETEIRSKQLAQCTPRMVKVEVELTAVELPPLLIENFSGRIYGR